MKWTVVILLLFCSVTPLTAQFGERNALYMGNEFNVGSYFGFAEKIKLSNKAT